MTDQSLPITSQSASGLAALSLVQALLIALEGKQLVPKPEIDQIWSLAISANEKIGDDGKMSPPNEEAAAMLRALHKARRSA